MQEFIRVVNRPLLNIRLLYLSRPMETIREEFAAQAKSEDWTDEEIHLVQAQASTQASFPMHEFLALARYCVDFSLFPPTISELYDPEDEYEDEYPDDLYNYDDLSDDYGPEEFEDEEEEEFDPDQYGNGDQYSFGDDRVYEEEYPDE